MAARKNRKAPAANPEPTARPRPISQELPAGAFAEEGLSVDPEDLGAQFLISATEQKNFESLRPAETAELSIASGAASDEPLVGPNMDVDRSLWEQSVDLTLQSGALEPPTLDAAQHDEEQWSQQADAPRGVNLLERDIQEGSLFDEEGDEPGGAEAPAVDTDDSTPNGRRDRTL